MLRTACCRLPAASCLRLALLLTLPCRSATVPPLPLPCLAARFGEHLKRPYHLAAPSLVQLAPGIYHLAKDAGWGKHWVDGRCARRLGAAGWLPPRVDWKRAAAGGACCWLPVVTWPPRLRSARPAACLPTTRTRCPSRCFFLSPTDREYYEDALAQTPPFEGFWHVQSWLNGNAPPFGRTAHVDNILQARGRGAYRARAAGAALQLPWDGSLQEGLLGPAARQPATHALR